MKIKGLLDTMEITINETKGKPEAAAAYRTFMVYRQVILYLVANRKLTMKDDESEFWAFTKEYTTGALYRVAEYHRKKHGQPPLNFPQPIYHIKTDSMSDYQEGIENGQNGTEGVE